MNTTLARATFAPAQSDGCRFTAERCVDLVECWPHGWRATDEDMRLVRRYMPRLGVVAFARALGSTVATVDRWVMHGVRATTARGLLTRLHELARHEASREVCACRLCTPSREERRDLVIDRIELGGGRCKAPWRWCTGLHLRLEVNA